MNDITPYVSRIISPIIASLLAWLTIKTGAAFSQDTASKLTEGAILLLIPFTQILNGVIHKAIDKYINPGDSASSHLGAVEKVETATLKANN